MVDYRYGPVRTYIARAREAAQKALLLDPRSAEAYAALGLIALDRKDRTTALDDLQHALALDPACGPAHEWYGVALLWGGQLRQGFAQLQAAANLEPLSVATDLWLGSAAYLDRHFHQAIAYSRQALDLSPAQSSALTTLGEAYEAEGNFSRAIDAFKAYAHANVRNRPEAAALLVHAYALSHRMRLARIELAFAQAHAKAVNPTDLIVAAAAAGERNVALRALREARSPMDLMAIENDPRFDTMRSSAVFRRFLPAPA
jgi:tetratricopeptide (TPR) repeat protein